MSRPVQAHDWADDLALTIIADAIGHPFRQAQQLVSARLRTLKAEGGIVALDMPSRRAEADHAAVL